MFQSVFLLLCLAYINSRLPQSKTSIVLSRLCFNVSICFSSSMFNIYKFTFTAEKYEHCSIKALFQHRRLYVSCFDKLPKQHSRVLTSVNVFSPGNFFIYFHFHIFRILTSVNVFLRETFSSLLYC